MKKYLIFFIICLVVMSCGIIPGYAMDTAINGFISQGYLKTDKNNWLAETEEGSFEINDMALRFSSRLTSRLFLGIQFYARDLGDLGNDEITLDWFAADYYYNSMLGIKVGKLKIPHGFYNESRDADFLRTSIFLPFSVYAEQWRDSFIANKGLGFYGDLFRNLSYYLQIGVLNATPDGGMAKSFNGLMGATITAIRPKTCYIANIQYRLIEGLRVGVSTLNSAYEFDMTMTAQPYDVSIITDVISSIWVYSAEYVYNNLTISGEYERSLREFDFEFMGGSNRHRKFSMEGYYGNMEYRFNDWFSLGVYYSVLYQDKDDKNGDYLSSTYGLPHFQAFSKETCISTRFDINHYWMVKLGIHFSNGTFNTYILDNKESDGTVDLEKYWTAFAAKVTYSF